MPEDKPVAVYHKEKRHMHVLRMSRHPYLEVDPVALDTLDSLIGMYTLISSFDLELSVAMPVSFLLIERRRREGNL